MLTNIFPFKFTLDATLIAGSSLWALALYLSFSSFSQWLIEQLNRWFTFAQASLYASTKEIENIRQGREAQNALYASIFSIVPFLMAGGLCNWGVELSLGRSWAISMGILACIGCGVYELGRRDGQSN
ncbi:hypothetical protein NDI39_29110 [Microcoleus sp. ZQ-A2]|jgi:hypothetical protein|nr:hypothetical protein [Microcoleus sp. FACHB-1]